MASPQYSIPLQPGIVGGVITVPNDRRYISWRGYVAIGYALLFGAASIWFLVRYSASVWSLVLFPPSSSLLDLVLLWSGSLFLVLSSILFFWLGTQVFWEARRWRLANQRRQQVVGLSFAAGAPLANPQPFPNAAALPPGFIIKLKANWLPLFLSCCLLVSILLFLSFGPTLEGNTVHQDLLSLAISSSYWVILLGRLSLSQRIVITPEALIVRHALFDWFRLPFWPVGGWQYGDKIIPWSDARLFAIREGKPGASKVRYEVSSPIKVVTFSRIVRSRWWSLYRPAQPFGEYNAQMDALLALISACTGLLLYDVR